MQDATLNIDSEAPPVEETTATQDLERLSGALENSPTAMMICDENFVITYMNGAVTRLLRAREAELQKLLPGFNVDGIIGTSIDSFHRDPSHQRSLLSDPSRMPSTSTLELAGLVFQVDATILTDDQGNRIGNCSQWSDITEQRDGEGRIRDLIGDAAAGNLDGRMDPSQYQGFMRGLSENVNQLLEAVVVPIRESQTVLAGLSDGRLDQLMTGEFQGEFGELRDSINNTITNLRDMVGKIRSSALHVSEGAQEISQGNTELSSRTEEQAATVEETVSSIEELAGTMRQNAENSSRANELSAGARDQAESGGEVVGSAVSAMGEISAASKRIADIIGVIDEIAFQTNLLALNAAVEAARAGEQGRGFAVVAAEVRNLAGRSASAAKEIKTLINDSVEKVGEGSRLVDASGRTLQEIMGSVNEVNDLIAEIATASDEQRVGFDQLSTAMSQIDQVTQQNAALVEEAAATAGSLDDQAGGLAKLMTFFKVSEGQQTMGSSRTPTVSNGTTDTPVSESGTNGDWKEF